MFGPQEFLTTLNVSRETLVKLEIYADLLLRWQKKTNLVGSGTVNDVWWRHFYDSAQLLPLILRSRPDGGGAKPLKWLDFGAGAGFPGLVISILGGGKVHLVESNGKKCTFMRQIVRETGADAIIHQCRIEDLPHQEVDIITSRALAHVGQLLGFSQRFITPTTEIWLLKGQDVDEELTKATISRNIPVERFKSKTDPDGVILRIKGVDMGEKRDAT